ncbi:hypothetical protein [Aquisphaera giovannonii]|nr:hypothetical protein [Aquisphaera giovannonii]
MATETMVHGGAPAGRPGRRGASVLLELEIAFAVLGVMLAGLCPYVVTQVRQARRLTREQPTGPSNPYFYHTIKPYTLASVTMRSGPIAGDGGPQAAADAPGFEYRIVPWPNPWTRKLAARARLEQVGGGQPSPAAAPDWGTLAPSASTLALRAFRPDGCVGAGAVTATFEAR